MTIENPPLKEHGFVVGRFVTAIADTLDDEDRYPDLRAIQGKIRFTPLQAVHLYAGEHPATVVRQPIAVDLDDQGYLRDVESQNYGGPAGLYLAVGQYRVDPIFESVTGVSRFTIEVTAEHTKDDPLNLTLAAPIETPPGFTEVVRISDRIRAEDAAEDAEGHAGQALVYRDEAQASAQSAETHAGEAQTSAGDAAQSATTAGSHADRAETARDETVNNAIEVDTSVGTKVSIGGHVVYYDSGWRKFPITVPGYSSATEVQLRRRLYEIDVYFRANGNIESAAEGRHVLFDLPQGFEAYNGSGALPAFNAYSQGPLRNANNGMYVDQNTLMLYIESATYRVGVSASLAAAPELPSTLPGTPA